ncbi:hypothetical protein H3146_05845 [Streptomyces sp. OF3]|uniref:Uncharacterized protein n=1 Tax=Streptomyces alkaliterrae TaxID=2213162 RepID=A0A7W3WIC0_9ACTN|nr:hypothetical protein [Streptomyces alkaliterrae]MBB1252889.1 hypothetical protein [Streptomyces alkaliterrae]
MTGFSPDDMAAMRKQGDIGALFTALLGKSPPPDAAGLEDERPAYHVARPGAWPCGTAPSGPSPGPTCGRCTTGGRPRTEPHPSRTHPEDTP